MIVRDGRGVEHNLGPRRTFAPSLMKIAAGYGEEATGGWSRVNVTRLERPRTAPIPKVVPEPRVKAERPPRQPRATCRPGKHPRPESGRCLECKRQAVRDCRARARAARLAA